MLQRLSNVWNSSVIKFLSEVDEFNDQKPLIDWCSRSWRKKWLIVENKKERERKYSSQKIDTESRFISDCFPSGLICTFHIWLRIKKKVFTISWLGIRLLGRLPVNMSAVGVFGWGLLKRIVSNLLESATERSTNWEIGMRKTRIDKPAWMKCMVFSLIFYLFMFFILYTSPPSLTLPKRESGFSHTRSTGQEMAATMRTMLWVWVHNRCQKFHLFKCTHSFWKQV